MAEIKILIAVHKDCFLPRSDIFLPIQVGRKNAKIKLNMQGDDEGENISEKNPNYSELTALFWAWKNLKNLQYIGLNHYRRYFSNNITFQHSNYILEEDFLKSKDNIGIPKNWKQDLRKYDIIKVKPFTYYHSIHSTLTNILSNDDLRLLEQLIKESYTEYFDTYINYMKYNNKISSCNMFICKFELFSEYSEWLFSILFELENHVKISQYKVPARIFGFLSEALFNIYCIKNNLNVKYYSIDVIRDDVYNESNVVYFLKNMRRNISFYFNKPQRIKP